jgi:hypothetical protein
MSASGAPSALVMLLLGTGGAPFFLWAAFCAVALSVRADSLVSGLQGRLVVRDGTRVSPAA